MENSSVFKEHIEIIKKNISKFAQESNRNPNDITIIAVTKKFPVNIWEKSVKVGILIFGENKIQEAQEKYNNFLEKEKIKLHFIGHLQSNKVKMALQLFDVIQTVDSFKLIEKIDINAKQILKKQKCFIQINISNDINKHGFLLCDVIKAAEIITKKENILLEGIMTILKPNLSEKEISKYYNKMKKIQKKLYARINNKCTKISMGMSNDYNIAIKEGATHIRLGTALYGKRKN